MYGLFDPSGKTLWLYVDHRRLRPVDDMVLLVAWSAFLTRRLPVVSRTGRTEYQLLLMKASDRGRNVNFLGNKCSE